MSPDAQPRSSSATAIPGSSTRTGCTTDRPTPVGLEAEGTLGRSSVQRGEYRYILRHPEIEAPRPERFGWEAGDIGYYQVHPEEDER